MRYIYQTQPHLIKEINCFEVGDLVVTIMGEYGVVLGVGPHVDYMKDQTRYYYVLIDGTVYHYIAAWLLKHKKS